jgi:DNA-binding NarL/FixJ family response regulator
MTMRVLLGDHYDLMIEGLRGALAGRRDMNIVGDADNGLDLLQLVRERLPDVIVMDVSMPDLDGVEMTERILVDHPGAKVIGLAVRIDKVFIKKMLEAGALGYLLKDCACEELIQAIETVVGGDIFFSRKIADTVAREYLERLTKKGDVKNVQLSSREIEVLKMIAEGCTTREIGGRLSLSTKTIESHRRNIMTKLRMKSIAQLTKYAIRRGLVPLEDG